METQIVALYEVKRQSLLLGYLQNRSHFQDALAFAYFNRLAPVLHENIARETYKADPFEEVYAVKASFISDVLKHVAERVAANDLEAIEFYNLEGEFGGHQENRVELIHTLEYARISGRFNDSVWAAIESNAPSEANSLDAAFSPDEIYFD
jgi:hypothetical protein